MSGRFWRQYGTLTTLLVLSLAMGGYFLLWERHAQKRPQAEADREDLGPSADLKHDDRPAPPPREEVRPFHSTQLLSFPASEVTVFLVERKGGLAERAERPSRRGPLGEGWELVQPVRAPADVDLMTRLLGTLSDLRAVRIMAETAAPAHGFAPPRARFTLSGDFGSHLLEIGAPLKGGACLARTGSPSKEPGDFGPVGVLPAEACRDLDRPLGRGSLLLLDDARVRRVTWEGVQTGPVVPPDLLSLLHRMEHGEVAGYGPDPSGPQLLSITVEQDPPSLPDGATPLSTVAPVRQVLTIFPPEPGRHDVRARLLGRPITYRLPIPVADLRRMTRSMKQ